jgi:hypothetical protein
LTTRHHKGLVRRDQGIDAFDYALLTLLSCLGLVWVRMFFMFAAVTAACAEHYASFGYVESGWLAGQTAWSLLYGTSALSLIFSLLIVLLYTRPERSAVAVFRIAMVCGFLLITLLFRALVIDDAMPPDGFVQVNAHTGAFQRSPIKRDEILEFRNFEEVVTLGYSACVYTQRQVLIVPEIFLVETPAPESVKLSSALEKGILIKRFQASQVYLDIADDDLPLIISRMQTDMSSSGWYDHWMKINGLEPYPKPANHGF